MFVRAEENHETPLAAQTADHPKAELISEYKSDQDVGGWAIITWILER
jgi:hypothetical protein